MGDAPAVLTEVSTAVEDRLRLRFRDERERWDGVQPQLGAFIGQLEQLVLGGGKRLRPAFCAWAAAAAGGQPDDTRVIDLGCALELLHAFALVHDDVMDGSDRRRGEPTLHVRAAEAHRRDGVHGEDRRYGDAVAILAGDYLHVMADHIVATTAPEATDLWRDLRAELNIGQYLDVWATAHGALDSSTATRITRYKSGLYTIERPLELGALVAGDPALGEALAAYGRPLGEAFQLRDDVLGTFGEEAVVGKPVGDDLREGKPTLLLAYAHEQADEAQRGVLATVGGPLDEPQVAAVQEVMVGTGALDRVEAEIERRTTEAIGALGPLGLDDRPQAALTDLARFVSARRF